ncbi:hypothetical protein LUZ61_020981 [Rhynchospora tenuis]|uniref:Neprosin PEP catalytic domain-containing protein n=1 Tax=Rhynchospora tenuis TaxID=198213 RepID=A0AAD6EPC2_9POAL|nr:hypothetical protein LUZ61_020981 [Rhynchospora tenuis]
MVNRVTLLVLLLTLLCIQSQGTRHNLELETATSASGDDLTASQDAPGSANVASSLSAIFQPQLGDFLSSYFAVYQAANGAYFGGGGRFDIYGHPNVTGHDTITTAVWIVGERDDRTLDAIQAGWHAADLGCSNTACEGFVKSDTAPISPGDALPISTPDEIHELIMWIEKDETGDWWLYASTESTASGKVGHWPKSLFSKLAENATVVSYGGFVQVKKGSVSPPMGSGHFPNDTAAFFSNVEYVDEFGRKIAGNLAALVTDKNCYDVGNMGDATFFYGGPGGCVPV